MSKRLRFPTLSKQEIISCLLELDIKAREDDIAKPSPLFCQQLYGDLIDIIFTNKVGETEDELLQESVGLMNLYQKLQKVTVPFECPLAIKDLLTPNRKRTAIIISCIINFIKFREEKLILYEELTQKNELLVEKLAATEQELTEKTTNVNKIKEKRNSEIAQVEENRVRIAAIQLEIKNQKAEQMKTQKIIDDLKLSKAQKQEIMNNNRLLMENLQMSIGKLKSSIIEDPVALKSNLLNSSKMLQKDKLQLQELKKNLLSLGQKQKNFIEIDEELQSSLACLEQLEAQIKSEKEQKKDTLSHKEKLQQKNSEMKQLDMKITQLEKICANGREKLKRLENHFEVRKGQNNDKLELARSEYERVKEVAEDQMLKTQENEQEAIKYEQLLLSEEKQCEEEKKQLNSAYAKLQTEIEKYEQELSKHLF